MITTILQLQYRGDPWIGMEKLSKMKPHVEGMLGHQLLFDVEDVLPGEGIIRLILHNRLQRRSLLAVLRNFGFFE